MSEQFEEALATFISRSLSSEDVGYALPVHRFETRGFCPNPECFWSVPVPFGNMFFVSETCCPRCGEPVRESWLVYTVCWVPEGRLFSPSTWGRGHWIVKYRVQLNAFGLRKMGELLWKE